MGRGCDFRRFDLTLCSGIPPDLRFDFFDDAGVPFAAAAASGFSGAAAESAGAGAVAASAAPAAPAPSSCCFASEDSAGALGCSA